ncbi:MAG: IS1380 family transposase, partial [Nocardioides sp.]
MTRLFTALAVDVDTTVAVIREARALARAAVWARRRPLDGTVGNRSAGQVIIDIDATLVTAHSDKDGAESTYKRGHRFHSMGSTIDHCAHGTGDAGVINPRPGRASAWT